MKGWGEEGTAIVQSQLNKNELHSDLVGRRLPSDEGLLKSVQCLAGIALMGHLGHVAERDTSSCQELKVSVSDGPIFGVSSEAFWLTNGKIIAFSTPLRLL